jgi:hypothetical protein
MQQGESQCIISIKQLLGALAFRDYLAGAAAAWLAIWQAAFLWRLPLLLAC